MATFLQDPIWLRVAIQPVSPNLLGTKIPAADYKIWKHIATHADQFRLKMLEAELRDDNFAHSLCHVPRYYPFAEFLCGPSCPVEVQKAVRSYFFSQHKG